MEAIGKNTVLRRVLTVAHPLESDQQLAVFDSDRSELVVLNSTGGAFWSLVDGQATLAEIANEMATHIEQAPSEGEVMRLLIDLAVQLLERGAVEVVS